MSETLGAISFNAIPPNLRVPLFYAEFDNTMAGANQIDQRALLIGQTINPLPLAPMFAVSPDAIAQAAGPASHLARMVSQYRLNDSLGELWVLPVPAAAGAVAAVGSIGFAAPGPFQDGVLSLYIGGQAVPVPVNAGEMFQPVLARAIAAINAVPAMPVVASASATNATIALTAVQPGTAGNYIDLRINYYGPRGGEALPGGMTIAVFPMAGGAGDPDLTGIAAALAAMEFDFIGSPYSGPQQTTPVTAAMGNGAGRWSPLNQSYGHVFSAKIDTAANLLTLGGTLNDPHLTMIGLPYSPSPPWDWVGAAIGAVAPALKADPARPVQTLPISGVLAPAPGAGFSRSVEQSLLTAGIGLAQFDRTGAATALRFVTTYQTNSFGQADQSYLDCETAYTLMAITRQLRAAFTQKYPRAKLAADGTRFGAGQPIVTPKIALAEIVAQYRQMEADGLVQDADAMIAATIVQISASDPSRLEVLWAPYLVSGLRIVALKNQFRLLAAA